MDDVESLPMESLSLRPACHHRVTARSEAWKMKQNARSMREIEDGREQRLFPSITPEEIAKTKETYRLMTEEKLTLAEAQRRLGAPIEPEYFQDDDGRDVVELNTITLPLNHVVSDVYSHLRDSGLEPESFCSEESLYRYSQMQYLNYVEPSTYKSLLSVTSVYPNFDIIVRCIQINSDYKDNNLHIRPVHDDWDARSITALSSLYFTGIQIFADQYPTTAAVARLCMSDINSLTQLPANYSLESLLDDAVQVRDLLTHVALACDSVYLQPRLTGTPLLQPAPYLALMFCLPTEEIYSIYKQSFDSLVRGHPHSGSFPVFSASADSARWLIDNVASGNLGFSWRRNRNYANSNKPRSEDASFPSRLSAHVARSPHLKSL